MQFLSVFLAKNLKLEGSGLGQWGLRVCCWVQPVHKMFHPKRKSSTIIIIGFHYENTAVLASVRGRN